MPPNPASLSAALVVFALVAGCALGTTSSQTSPSSSTSGSPVPTAAASPTAPEAGTLVIVGRIVTMGEPATAQALFIEDGTVASVGTREKVLALAGDLVPVMDIGPNVAYPGFIDAHAHWIGDRDYYHLGSTAEATLDIAGRTARSRLPRGPPRDRERCPDYLTILKPQSIALTIADATPPA